MSDQFHDSNAMSALHAAERAVLDAAEEWVFRRRPTVSAERLATTVRYLHVLRYATPALVERLGYPDEPESA